MDAVLVDLAFHRVTETDWSLSCSSLEFISYNFARCTVHGYDPAKIGPENRQKVDHGSMMPVMEPAIDVNWLPGFPRKKFSEV